MMQNDLSLAVPVFEIVPVLYFTELCSMNYVALPQ
jgi:hypothetical protein